jgi:hypothetical protein
MHSLALLPAGCPSLLALFYPLQQRLCYSMTSLNINTAASGISTCSIVTVWLYVLYHLLFVVSLAENTPSLSPTPTQSLFFMFLSRQFSSNFLANIRANFRIWKDKYGGPKKVPIDP